MLTRGKRNEKVLVNNDSNEEHLIQNVNNSEKGNHFEKLSQIKNSSRREIRCMRIVCNTFDGFNTDTLTHDKRNAKMKIPAIKDNNDENLFQIVDSSEKKKHDGELSQIRENSGSKQFEEKFSYGSNDEHLKMHKFTVNERDQCSAALQEKDELHKCTSTCTINTPLTCSKCSKGFQTTTSLKRHMITHSTLKPFTCAYCNRAFKHKEYLTRHITAIHNPSLGTHTRNTHTRNTRPACSECSKVFNTVSGLKYHMISHSTEKPFTCAYCNSTFNYKGNLLQHIRTSHNFSLDRHNINTPFACSECSKVFKRVSNFKDHMITHSTEKPFTCASCNHTFKRKYDLIKHIRTIHNLSLDTHLACSVCSKVFKTVSNFKDHMITHSTEKPFTCASCNHTFKRKYALIKHIRTIHNLSLDTHLACSVCSKVFKVSYLKRHMIAHSTEKPLTCAHCNSTFKRRGVLTEHIRRIHNFSLDRHNINTPFACSECSKVFRTVSYLKRHMVTHSTEKPFTCASCNHTSKRKDDLIKHIRTIHNLSLDTHFGCSECSKVFKTVSYLKQHMMTHSTEKPFTCSYCNSTFKRKYDVKNHINIMHTRNTSLPSSECSKVCKTVSNLKVHMITHSTEKPFTCASCNHTFKRKHDLIKHMRTIHTINTPLACSVCSKVFKTVSYLKRHMIAHSTENWFTCNYCNNTYKRKDQLIEHIRSIHNLAPRHFHCNQCNKKYHNRSNLKKHLMVHSNKKVTCKKAFKFQGDLKNNTKVIHASDKKELPVKQDFYIEPTLESEKRYNKIPISSKNYLGNNLVQKWSKTCVTYRTRYNCKTTPRKDHEPIYVCHKPKLFDNIATEIGNKGVCLICDQLFMKESELLAHLENVHGLNQFASSSKDSMKKLKNRNQEMKFNNRKLIAETIEMLQKLQV